MSVMSGTTTSSLKSFNFNRGGYNMNYNKGFKVEYDSFLKYKKQFMYCLQADSLELSTRGLADIRTGTDGIALINGNVYAVGLRFRNHDYESFTLSRHISDINCEILKFIKKRGNKIKPSYFVQLSMIDEFRLRAIRINVDLFAEVLKALISSNKLELYYKPHLQAYEFKLNEISKLFPVHSEIIYLT